MVNMIVNIFYIFILNIDMGYPACYNSPNLAPGKNGGSFYAQRLKKLKCMSKNSKINTFP